MGGERGRREELNEELNLSRVSASENIDNVWIVGICRQEEAEQGMEEQRPFRRWVSRWGVMIRVLLVANGRATWGSP